MRMWKWARCGKARDSLFENLSLDENLQRSVKSFRQSALHHNIFISQAPRFRKTYLVAQQKCLKVIWFELNFLKVLQYFWAEFTSLRVGIEWLCFEHQHSVWFQLLEYSFEHEFYSLVAVVELNPLSNRQAEYCFVERLLELQKASIFKDVVCLPKHCF